MGRSHLSFIHASSGVVFGQNGISPTKAQRLDVCIQALVRTVLIMGCCITDIAMCIKYLLRRPGQSIEFGRSALPGKDHRSDDA